MVQSRLVIKWSSLAFENQIPVDSKNNQNGRHLRFTIQNLANNSGFLMVDCFHQKIGLIFRAQALPFENLSPKCPVLKGFQFSKGLISDSRCILQKMFTLTFFTFLIWMQLACKKSEEKQRARHNLRNLFKSLLPIHTAT